MRKLLILILSFSFLGSFAQEKELSIIVSSNSEAEVVIRLINNTSKNKYLLLDVKNLGILYQSEMNFTNINSSKMYLDFLELNGNKSFIPTPNFNLYESGSRADEDFKYYLGINTLKFLPKEEKIFVINLYKQVESDYLKIYKVLPAKKHKVVLKILGNQIREKIKNTSYKKHEFDEIISKYDFSDYHSNEFIIKIKTIQSPPPPPLPPNQVYDRYNYKELINIK